MKKLFLILCLVSLYPTTIMANEKILRIYHDADWSNHIESAQSIWRGVKTALSEIDNKIQGYRIILVKKNHHGNMVRSLKNLKDFNNDPKALAVISGIHSPPLIKNLKYINQHKILTLVPWAAGGPITRYPSPENWVFRLSLDDTKAGQVLINYAIDEKHCSAIHLLLEDTPWGQSNLKNMTKALADRNMSASGITKFGWSFKGYQAHNELIKISRSNAQCIILVSNAVEGIEIANAMLKLSKDKRLPIISHWGITAGNFHEEVNRNKRSQLNLEFIQSCYSLMKEPLDKNGREVLAKAKREFKDIDGPEDIHSPVGFIHGYDITQLFIAALNQVSLDDDMDKNKIKVRHALENLSTPVSGLIKNYKRPYSEYSESNRDAHEALGENDLCMAKYNENGNIVLINNAENND